MVKGSRVPKAIMHNPLAAVSQALRQVSRGYVSGKHTTTDITVTVKTFWWSITYDTVVHRAAKLRHDGVESWIIACDLDHLATPEHVEEHEDGTGPLITCIWCAAGTRRR